jgi:benzoylformate decarboxylase
MNKLEAEIPVATAAYSHQNSGTQNRTTPRTGSQILLEVLRSEGVELIFGNPGTTELALLDALAGADDLHYVLGLQEASVLGMADGYAQASGKVAFVNLHACAGLGNAMGNLSNARMTNVPIVITAGQQDQRHLVYDPLLTGDVVSMARPLCKWAQEVRTVEELPILLRRAFHDAATYPCGPVFLSLPMDVMEAISDLPLPARTARAEFEAPSMDEMARRLTDLPARTCIVAGELVARSGAVDALVQIAEALDVPVFGSPFHTDIPFPVEHPLWQHNLPIEHRGMLRSLEQFERILVIDDHPFLMYNYTDTLPYKQGTRLLQMASHREAIGRCHAVEFGVAGSLGGMLTSLSKLLEDKNTPAAKPTMLRRITERNQEESDRNALLANLKQDDQIHPLQAAAEILKAVPQQARIVDESLATNAYVRRLLHGRKQGHYHFMKGAGLGWGMPAAVGVALAHTDEPVVCLVGDGAALYSPQAMWTAAHLELPVTFIVLNNAEYNILKNYLRSRTGSNGSHGRFVGMEIDKPVIDYVAMAESYGLSAQRFTGIEGLQQAIKEAIHSSRPSLIEVMITPVAY